MRNTQQLSDSAGFIFFLASMVALGPFSIDAYMPLLPEMANSLNTDMTSVTLTISAYFGGLAFGQFIGGPLSDQLGRKTIGVIGLALFIASSILIAVAGHIQIVQILRVFQAIGAGFATVICLAQVRDVFPPKDVPKKMANIILVMLIAPIIAPPIGIIISVLGWQAIFVFLAIYGGALMCVYVALFPETHIKRDAQLNIANLGKGYWQAISRQTNGHLLALRYAIFGSLTSGVFLAYLTSMPFIFIEYFAYKKIEFALLFALNGLALMLGNRLAVFLMARFKVQGILKVSNLIQISVLLFLLIVGTVFTPNMLMVLITLTMIAFTSGLMSPINSGHYIGLHELNLGSASSLLSTLTFVFGALIGASAAALSHGALLPIFAVMLLALIVARLVISKAIRLELVS